MTKLYHLSCYTREHDPDKEVKRKWWEFFKKPKEFTLQYSTDSYDVRHRIEIPEEEAQFLIGKTFRDPEVMLVVRAMTGTDLVHGIELLEVGNTAIKLITRR